MLPFFLNPKHGGFYWKRYNHCSRNKSQGEAQYGLVAEVHANLEQVDDGGLLVQDKVDVDVGSLLGDGLQEVREHFFFPNLPKKSLQSVSTVLGVQKEP